MTRIAQMCGLAICLVVTFHVSAVKAVTHVNDFQLNLTNYRMCDSGDPVGDTCDFGQVVSPSIYYLTSGTKGTVVVNQNGIVKLRIDSIKLDKVIANYPNPGYYQCDSKSYTCGTMGGGGCGSGKRCQAGPKKNDCCVNDGDCQAVACTSGPQIDKACSSYNDCESMDGIGGFKLVFRGHDIGGYLTGSGWKFRMYGCKAECEFATENDNSPGVGDVDIDNLSCSILPAQVGGSCPAGLESYDEVEILDPNGAILAIGYRGNAVENDSSLADGDPAVQGDCFRTPKPAVCP